MGDAICFVGATIGRPPTAGFGTCPHSVPSPRFLVALFVYIPTTVGAIFYRPWGNTLYGHAPNPTRATNGRPYRLTEI